MATPIEKIEESLRRIEGEVAQLQEQVNQLLANQKPQPSPTPTIQFVDKEKLRPLTEKVFKKMGIHGEPIDAEELQKMVEACGVKPEENLFSRGIIEMREE